jgi:hypothetical protein
MSLELIGELQLPAHDRPGGFDHAAVHSPRGSLYVAHTANNIVKLWDDSIGGGPAIGDQTRAETLALTRAVVELEAAAYHHLAKAAAPPPRQLPPRPAEGVRQALQQLDP